MSDTSFRNEAPVGPDYTAIATGSAISRLAVVTPLSPVNGHGACELCASDGSLPAGFAISAAAEGDPVQVTVTKLVQGTPEEWDARTGSSGGLAAGALYYLDQGTDGNITASEPVSGTVTPVGLALSPTTMLPVFALPFAGSPP